MKVHNVLKGDETVGHLPHKFSQIVWYFLARSGKISVEVISCRRRGRMEVPWQLEFNFLNKVRYGFNEPNDVFEVHVI